MYRSIKPYIDFVGAMALSIMLLPLITVIIALLAVKRKGIFFRQKRQGHNGKIFHIYKFKTMDERYNEDGELLPDEKRMTGLGLVLRKFSLDELPQLYNVLKGEMSLIGPRPLLPEYDVLYSDFQKIRFRVKPGMTGWAQVNGRNMISWEEKFDYDNYYVNSYSFLLDFKIVLLTLKKVVVPEGVFAKGFVSSPKFQGSGVLNKNLSSSNPE